MTTKETYNGWANYETWNVALWIGNDEGLYSLARDFKASGCPYNSFIESLEEINVLQTPDDVAWGDSGLDHDALDEMIREL